MKKAIIKSMMLIAILSVSFTAFSQTISKKAIYEIFTSATCDPCFAANANMEYIFSTNPGEYSLIKYQMNWPTGGDPYYTPQGGDRKEYYGVVSIPDLFVNSIDNDPTTFTQALFDQYAALLTNMSIGVTASILADGMITVNANLQPEANFNAGLKAHIVVVEKTTVGNYKWNGETEFHNVMMVMLPGSSGTTLGALTNGTPVPLTQTYDMNTTFMEEPTDLAVVVFVQDDNTKEVIQSEMADVTPIGINSYTLTLTVKDTDGMPVSGAEVELEAHAQEYTDASGQLIYPAVFPRTYSYRIFKAGYDVVFDSVVVTDQNVTLDVVLLSPNTYLLYEDFEGSSIPADWTALYTDPNEIYIAFDESIVLYRGMTGGDLRLISPSIPLNQAQTLFVECGQSNQYPDTYMVIGTVPEPTSTATFTELARFIPQEVGFGWIELDLSNYSGTDTYLAWEYIGPNGWYVIETVNVTDEFTGIGDQGVAAGQVQCYPNPTDGLIQIKSGSGLQKAVIRNQWGVVVLIMKLSGRLSAIDVSRFSSGLYIMEVTSRDGVETQKFIRK
ncbi:MAG: T9SS type A sorting domain-containing protein [Bacteroidales bacterium]|nr:T9SS type A sorting domain-containing protein [Bacteroidales bacterium]